MDDLIVNFAPTGMIPTKKMTPYVPIEPQEIVEDVLKCCEMGVTIVHLHARNEKGEPEWNPDAYAYMIAKIRKYNPDLIIAVTCSGRTFSEFEKRSAVLDLEGNEKPDMASLTLSSVNFNKIASINEPEMIMALTKKMKDKGIKPELEAFDLGMINYSKYLINKKLLNPPYYFNLLLGNIACAQANLLSAGLMEKELPDNSIFAFAGIGDYQLYMNALGIINGCGVRVGLEDNIWLDSDRKVLATNYMLIERIHELAGISGRKIMSPVKARTLLNLKQPEKGYGELI